MPPRDNELPEGTDHIINGAMETNGGGGGGGSASGGGAASGFVGSAGGDDTGGTTAGGGTGVAGVTDQLRGQVSQLKDQAGGRVRDFAQSGKSRATDALEELSRVVSDTADSIDERLGNNYGEYARRAADAVSGVADTLRRKEVDELYEDLRQTVRKSPGVAIGVAAVVGFTLVRLIKAGFENEGSGSDAKPGDIGSRGSGSGGGASGGTGA
jgi:ElaB/YqjD/DUF883 family membrane-anchored ribosome-binding protein